MTDEGGEKGRLARSVWSAQAVSEEWKPCRSQRAKTTRKRERVFSRCNGTATFMALQRSWFCVQKIKLLSIQTQRWEGLMSPRPKEVLTVDGFWEREGQF